jgi:hypothetical protein
MAMSTPVRALVIGFSFVSFSIPASQPAQAQYAETPQVLATVDGGASAATQIGRRLFVAGSFDQVGPPTGGAVVVDADGTPKLGAFPFIDGSVNEIVADGLGGWVVVGGFRQVAGQPFTSFVRIRPDRAVDSRYRITVDGPIRRIRIAHGRVYLLGDFSEINGNRRLGLAALDVSTGQLSPWGSEFDPGVDSFTGLRRTLRELSVSSTGVYVSGGGNGLRYPQSSSAGRLWGLAVGSGARLFERAAFVTAIAATSTRVYVGGYRQPVVWAVDPLTGADVAWAVGLTFRPVGSQEMRVTSLLIDGSRLYLGGYFQTTDDQRLVSAVDAATGQPSPWRASEPPGFVGEVTGLTRLGQGLVVMQNGQFLAYDVATGVRLPWMAHTHGAIATLAAAPEGAVLGGRSFNEFPGVARRNLISFNLDTGQLEPWTSALADSVVLEWLDTDGTYLFGATNEAQVFKIDPGNGTVLGTIDFGSGNYLVTARVAGDRIVVVAGHSLLGVITIADWSQRSMPLSIEGIGMASRLVHDLEVLGDTAYLAGRFTSVNGAMRPHLAALDLGAGGVLPFNASPDAEVESVRVANGRLLAAGRFRRIGGARRRSLAELDPITGRARTWNPDAPGGASLDVGGGGTIFVAPASTISGRSRGRLAAFSPLTGTWLPWRPALGDEALFVEGAPIRRKPAFLTDCLLPTGGRTVACYRATLPSPTAPTVRQAGSQVSFSWTLPVGPQAWTGLRVDVGKREGASDIASVALPPDATSIASTMPQGSYFARVRTSGPAITSVPTADVSFAVGPPDLPAPPLDPTAVAEGTLITFQWGAPSAGAPPAYVIEAETAGGGADVTSPSLSGATTSFVIDAAPGRYWGHVRSANTAGASAPSSEWIIDVDATESPCYEMPPLAPQAVIASVSGRTVSLLWVQPDTGPVASTQRVVAGAAPGLGDLANIEMPGPATSFTTTAPPGIYYVKVVALNACGSSPSSNEVRVVVP